MTQAKQAVVGRITSVFSFPSGRFLAKINYNVDFMSAFKVWLRGSLL